MDHIVALCAPLFRTQPPQATPPPPPPPPPPPLGSSPAHWLLGAFPTLPLSQQSVAVDLPLRLVSVSCLFLYAQVCFLCGCSLCFLNKYKCLVFLPFLCSASSHLQCSVPLCRGIRLAAIRVIWQCPWFVLGLTWQCPRRAVAVKEGSHQLAGGVV